MPNFDIMHAAAGLLVGLLVGLTGVGGGSLMTPLLVLMFGVSPKTAIGTDLLFAAATKITGSAVHGMRDSVDWTIVRRLATGSIPAAFVTLALLGALGNVGPASEHGVMIALAVLLGITAVTVLLRNQLIGLAAGLDPKRSRIGVGPGTVVLGAAIGVAVSISSVGAGAIGMSVLLMLYPREPIPRIVGSDIAHAVPLALIAGFGHWIIGDVNLALLASLLLGSIPGVVIGSLVGSRTSEAILRPLLAVVLAISAWQLFAKAEAPVLPVAHAAQSVMRATSVPSAAAGDVVAH